MDKSKKENSFHPDQRNILSQSPLEVQQYEKQNRLQISMLLLVDQDKRDRVKKNLFLYGIIVTDFYFENKLKAKSLSNISSDDMYVRF